MIETQVTVLMMCFIVHFVAEAFNSVVEEMCDFIHRDHNKAIGKIKDMAAGVVLVTIICVLIIQMLVLYTLLND